MFLTYEDTIRFLYDSLPMFQRIGPAALKNDLSNTIKLCAALGNPQEKFKSIHVAGTNGKGSTSHMLASILQSAGYKTGLYTSPHLKSFTERIRINGIEVSDDFIVDFVNRIQPLIGEIQPSFFEITVVMAFDYFASCNIDVAVIEVGLGGRLDSTNVIHPVLSVITNIGWDHKDILGDTLDKIALEKAGIIKSNVPVVVSERQSEIDHIFITQSNKLNAPIYFASDEYTAIRKEVNGLLLYDILKEKKEDLVYQGLSFPLQGFYQSKNIKGVLKSIELLKSIGWKIPDNALRGGLRAVVEQTGLKGRWQILNSHPLTVCDTAHNVDGITEVVRQITAQSYLKLHIVLGLVKDKDVTEILLILPKDACYYFCQANIPRAMDAGTLAEMASHAGLTGLICEDVNQAIKEAEKAASVDDMIFIGGSTFVVAEIENL